MDITGNDNDIAVRGNTGARKRSELDLKLDFNKMNLPVWNIYIRFGQRLSGNMSGELT